MSTFSPSNLKYNWSLKGYMDGLMFLSQELIEFEIKIEKEIEYCYGIGCKIFRYDVSFLLRCSRFKW